jgi:hypothetical protein
MRCWPLARPFRCRKSASSGPVSSTSSDPSIVADAVNPLFAAALDLQRFFDDHRWRFCFIGGLAVQRWGEPRLTLDVDCTLLTGFGQESRYVDDLLAAFPGRVDDARGFALSNRVLLLHGRSRIPLDVALGAMPFEVRCVERASPFDIGSGQALVTCSAEDLIVLKAFAARDRDWLDIETIIVRQQKLRTEIIWGDLTPLLELKEDEETGPRLRRLLSTTPPQA